MIHVQPIHFRLRVARDVHRPRPVKARPQPPIGVPDGPTRDAPAPPPTVALDDPGTPPSAPTHEASDVVPGDAALPPVSPPDTLLDGAPGPAPSEVSIPGITRDSIGAIIASSALEVSRARGRVETLRSMLHGAQLSIELGPGKRKGRRKAKAEPTELAMEVQP